MSKEKILRLKEVMKEKNISRSELAKLLNRTNASVSNFCNHHSHPTCSDLLKMANVLNVDIRELFYPTKEDSSEKRKLEVKEKLQESIRLLEEM